MSLTALTLGGAVTGCTLSAMLAGPAAEDCSKWKIIALM
jgi:hypothetical protein